ncbi:MAG TPA: sigma-54 dependent transcriptional regulator [Candidatus Sulfotelmatobacter sp.]|nr:sigma-54 dependent transcriptional regulator [Candidatus Sulfotelmatobacter sp.]
MKPKILLVEDTPSLAALYRQYLSKLDAEVIGVERGADALTALDQAIPDVVLLDLQLPDMNGLEILKQIKSRGIPTLPIVITAHGSVVTAVQAMRDGAYDFLLKPFTADRLLVTVKNALDRQQRDQATATMTVASAGRFQGFVGSSPAMQAVYRIIESAARSKATVFVTGESGTGKELCAEAVRALSPRRTKPFVALNCGAIPRDLIESELFGHVKGAFTGASAEREGAIARADGGTLFLDELCEMDINLQVKLLRVLQSGTYQRVGGSKLEQADVRYVCATNRDPWSEVLAGRFREDLYYRLYVIPIVLPPLRERDDDILLIAQHFLKQYAAEEGKRFERFSPDAEDALRAFAWPGNVRQLQNLVRSVVVLHDGEAIDLDMLPAPLGRAPSPGGEAPARAGVVARPPASANGSGSAASGAVRPLWMIEKEAIENAIEVCGGNIPKAASLLDVAPSTIYRKKLAWA